MAISSLRLRRTLTTLFTFHCSLAVASSSVSAPPLLHLHDFAYNSSTNQSGEIGPDTILFEGCDYNHCLIVMDFPKDQKIPPEEMVPMYKETCAKGLNISVEEAKKKIYACSTTTYVGFQAVMIEEESEKFHVFVLPDSYIDPQNKEYGGH
nr:multiple organellar RNA editing factor 1, mitochondrial-like [Ziziphus jujuba var. spinosa]